MLSLNKKDDPSNSVYRFEAALKAVETEFVSIAIQSFLGGIKTAIKVRGQIYFEIINQYFLRILKAAKQLTSQT